MTPMTVIPPRGGADPAAAGTMPASVAALLAGLEELSRSRPDRVLRLTGTCPVGSGEAQEPFELLIFRGFSSSTTHPTAFNPDLAALPEGSRIAAAELLEGPLDPASERPLSGPVPVLTFLDPGAW